MKIKLLTEKNYKTTLWSGGKTAQIAIYPLDADFSNKDFIWRISSATVETDKSVFTDFSNYNRYIATLKGNIKLIHENDENEYLLNEYQLHKFDGAVKTTSSGKCTDYNLMLRKNIAEAEIKSLNLKPDEIYEYEISENNSTAVIFCGKGSINLTYPENLKIGDRETAIIEDYVGKIKIKSHCNSNIIFQIIKISK